MPSVPDCLILKELVDGVAPNDAAEVPDHIVSGKYLRQVIKSDIVHGSVILTGRNRVDVSPYARRANIG